MTIAKMKKVQRLDSISLDQTFFTDEGYLIDHPIVTSTGIFEYTNPDGSTRRELRLPEDVFAEKSLKSYKGKPVIITHDAGYVNKDNVDGETIGTILSDGYQDGDDVRAEIIIHDTDAMKASGLKELSLGYNLRLEETPGVWNGQPYDAIQRDIVINHLALVGSARAGEQARLNIDSREQKTLKGGKVMAKKTKSRADGMLSPEELTAAIEAYKQRRAERMGAEDEDDFIQKPMTEEDEEEFTSEPQTQEKPEPAADSDQDTVQMVKDRRDRRDAEGDPEEMGDAMGVIAQQDEDIDTLLGVIDVLRAAGECAPQTDGDEDEENADDDEETSETDEDEEEPAKADRKDSKDDFREMLRVVRIGDKLRMDGLEMMSVKGAKKAVLKKLKPSLRLDGKSVAYVNAAFDMAVNDLNNTRKDTNYQRRQMMHKDSKKTKSVGSASEARQRMIDKRMKKEEN